MSDPIRNGGAGTLYEETIRLLKNRPRPLTLQGISRDTGLPEGWLLSILRRPNGGANVNRVQKLYEYLSGKTLVL